MVEQAGTEQAMEEYKQHAELRAMQDPQRVKEFITNQRKEFLTRGEQLLFQRDQNADDPNLPDDEREAALEQIDLALDSIYWRVSDIDERLEAFAIGEEAGMSNRATRRRLAKKGIELEATDKLEATE